MIEEARKELEQKVEVAAKNKGRDKKGLVFHYTDQIAARSIMSMRCGFASKGFNHPDGNYRPAGFYATRIPPWIPGWTQSDLRSVLYAKPKNQDVSYFVALGDSGFRNMGVEEYKPGPRGSCVPVDPIYTGANLMIPQ